ncbi:WD40/YVTN/BNR-like repeat-containing protein [Alicyclobacillus mengziensis]|uniref:Photosynthesis system II assembly factor Ycf48/Hcf136-like domain-containing protein n=1 Tax=Alicyclobacillus mengziensis TaxID=2931921 RepID=A0A9X7VWF1_9BACL|nr:hypothetical protein [Alicyclobacillus mengziensis]QSO46326.1 hypothetical protein JZ786_17760 [Alicyclobacillus mengziensis]
MINSKVGWGVVYSTKGATVVRTADGGKSWFDVSPRGTRIDTPDGVDFINEETAWMTIQPVSQSTHAFKTYLMLYHTNNGGQTWSSMKVLGNNQPPIQETEISIVNPSTIYIDIVPEHGMNSMPGQLTVSDNGGTSWRTVTTPSDVQLGGSLQFVAPSRGWLSTSNSTTGNYQLYQTLDGGTSWHKHPVPVPPQYQGDKASLSLPQFSAANPNLGILEATFQGQGSVIEHRGIYSTSNAGRSWSFVGPLPGQAGFVSFPNTRIGAAIPLSSSKTFPTLYETTDGGESWTSVALPRAPFSTLLKNYVPSQLDFVSKNVGWMVWGSRRGGSATEEIWNTTDGGRTWTKVFS